MEAVSLLEGEVLENDKGHFLMENSQDSTLPEDHQLLSSRQVRSVYLLTYSEADAVAVPDTGRIRKSRVGEFQKCSAGMLTLFQ